MYGHYYAAQAMWQAGGEHWKKWYPAVQEVLVRQQQQDGSWQDLICSEYGTAMSCMASQKPSAAPLRRCKEFKRDMAATRSPSSAGRR